MSKNAEKGAATRQHILIVAGRLFANAGFDATPIEVVLQECNISRGALYHHFASKEALFEAVFEELEAQAAQSIIEKSLGTENAMSALRAGCSASIDLVLDEGIRQIVFIDAPAVLGWEKWRAIEGKYSFGLIRAGLSAVSTESSIAPELLEPYAHILQAALIEMGMVAARAEDTAAASKVAKAAIQDLLNRLLGKRSAGSSSAAL